MKYLVPLLCVGFSLMAEAAPVPTPLQSDAIRFSLVGSQDSYDGATLASEVKNTGFRFEFQGNSFAYELTLELGSQFANQTGLIGYAVGVKIGNEDVTWAPLTGTGTDPQTYKYGLTLVPDTYWVTLLPAPKPSTAAQALVFSNTAPVPAIPEPESYAMMLLGLGIVGSVARKRRNKIANPAVAL